MKPRKNRFLITAASALLLAPAAFALDGTWINPAGGSWIADTNWAGGPPGIIAEGAGFTANFSTLNPTVDTTVTLDGARTIGNLTFGDTDTSSAASWIVASGTTGPLTLDAGASSPIITVNALGTNKFANFSTRLEGTNGFTKTGAGNLLLNNGTNTISGAVVMSQGNIQLNTAGLTNATTVAINAGTLVVAMTAANAIGGTISFGGGILQYNVSNPTTDYSAQFSTAASQQYKINVTGANTVTIGSSLASVGGALSKGSSGTLTLAAANTFSGATTIGGGNLVLSNALALQNSAIDTTNSIAGTNTVGLVLNGVTSPIFGGLTGNKALASLFDTDSGNYGLVTNVTLNPGAAASYSYAAAIADGAAGMTLTKTGAGTQTLTVANSYSGGTILSGGTLNYSNASALSSGSISFTGNSTLQAGVATNLSNAVSVATGVTGTVDTNGNTTTLSGAITGDGNLTKTSSGMLTLSGGAGNTLSGAINVNGGTLAITKGTDNVSSAKNMPGVITVASGATLSFDQAFTTAPANNLANALNLSGSGTSATAGALHLFGNATASGAITLDNDATITKSFNSCFITGSITGADKNLTLKTSQSGQPGLTVSAPISLGTGGITVTGAGGTNIVTLSGANNYSGGTTVTAGTLKFANASALGSGGVSITGDATLQAGVATTLANAVSVATGVTGTVDTNGNTTTLSGAITGDGNLTKTGSGMLTLAGGAGNALAGAINVNAGTLTITKGSDDVSSVKNMPGTITVASGATLNFDQAFTTTPDNNLTNALNLSGVGTGGRGALNLLRNATASGTITLAADTTISHDFNTATISGSITGAGFNLTLATTESSQPGMVISGPISLDTGGITVNGAGGTNTVTLSGNNSYSGETHVVTGELKLSGVTRVPNASTVRIDTGAVLHLDFADTDSVAALYLPGDPNPKPNGTYGSLTSTATNKSADFLGGGILQVGAGGGSPYATWAGSALFTDDANGDGVDNGLAWILGAASPTVSALNKLPQVGTPSGYLTLSFSRVNPYAPAKLYIEYSINLSTWTKLEIPAASGTIPSSDVEVVVTPGSPDAVTVKIPTTHASGGKLFGRLSSTEN